MVQKIVPHSRPTLGDKEVEAVTAVIKSGHIAQGDKVRELEERLTEFTGTKGTVVTNSGTSALHLALTALGVTSGDDVLLPAYVCSAPLNAVYMTGAYPVLCDIDPKSYNISFESILNSKQESSKAVIIPHMFGSPVDLEKIEKLEVPVIEDCAQAIGAMYGERCIGSIGRVGVLSFYANKMVSCGEGGALFSNDENILRAARDLRDYDEKEVYRVRYNYKLTDMQAAMGLVQLEKLPGMIEKRKNIALRYNEAFEELDIILPVGEFDHVYYRYVVRTKKNVSSVISFLKEKDVIAARPIFKPLHRYFEPRSGFHGTDEAYSTALSIPIYPSLTTEEEEMVIRAVKECFG